MCRVGMFPRCVLRKKIHLQNQMAKMVGLLLLSSLCCPLHAQSGAGGPAPSSSTSNSTSSTSPSPQPSAPPPTTGNNTPDSSAGSLNDVITSETNVINPETRVLISAPYAIFSTSLHVFTTGIPIQPVYIQAPSGLIVWLTIQCRGGAARVTLPQFVANFTMVQTDPTGEWILPSLPLNNSWPVTGLGIKFNQNVSIANDALGTLRYGKGADNDIVGKATMTITLNWNATSTRDNRVSVFAESKSIYIWAPTALTSLSTFQATVAGVCIVGIFGLCCIGCLNSVGVSYLRRFNVLMARETRDQQECEQNRVFNPMWMPCAPSQPGYYNIESTPNSVMLVQRRMEIKTLILRTPTTFSLMDRLTRAKYLKSSNYGWFGLQLPWTAPPPRRQVDWSSDDESPVAPPRRGSQQANRFREVSTMRQPRPSVQPPPNYSPQRPSVQFPPNYSPQRPSVQLPQNYPTQSRAPSYNWPQNQVYTNYPQAQAEMHNTQYPGAPNYSQAQAGMYTSQNVGAPSHPQAQAGVYNSQGQMYSGASGNRLNYETITVGFAFIHHRFAQDAARPEILELEEEMESGSVRCEGVSELPENVDDRSECFGSPLSDLYEDVLES